MKNHGANDVKIEQQATKKVKSVILNMFVFAK